ncbi:MAG: DMT family transporter [Thermoleophilia bacterium]|nr:DMT family transporter [Thermoleophilia bacterium]
MRWTAALAALTASWGLIAVLVAAVSLDAEALAFWRLAIAAVTLAVVALLAGRLSLLRPAGHLGPLIALGVVQGAHWLFFFVCVKEGSVALAVLTFTAAPLLIALAAPLWLPDRAGRVAHLALVPGAAGVVLVVIAGQNGIAYSGWAIVAGLGSAATYAALVILSKRLLLAAVAPFTVAFWDCLAGAVVVAPVLLLAGRVLPVGVDELGAVLLLGMVLTGLSTLAYAFLLRRVSAPIAGVLTFLEPVCAIALAWPLVGERPGLATLAGGVLVLVAGLAVVASDWPCRPARLRSAS